MDFYKNMPSYECLVEDDCLYVPVVSFDVLKEYKEFYGFPVFSKNPKLNDMPCVLAEQQIRFRLDRTGAVLKSESLGGFFGEPMARDFIFDRPFLVMLIRKDAKLPYFARWVGNDELLTPAAGEPQEDGNGGDAGHDDKESFFIDD